MEWPYLDGYDVAPEGDRFVVIREEPAETADCEPEPAGLNVALNWSEELAEQVPVP